MMELSLRKSGEEVMKVLLNKEITTIGRAPTNDVCLPDAAISRLHLTISRQGDQFVATDKSTNGTLINDQRITTHVLKPHDLIRVGAEGAGRHAQILQGFDHAAAIFFPRLVGLAILCFNRQILAVDRDTIHLARARQLGHLPDIHRGRVALTVAR